MMAACQTNLTQTQQLARNRVAQARLRWSPLSVAITRVLPAWFPLGLFLVMSEAVGQRSANLPEMVTGSGD